MLQRIGPAGRIGLALLVAACSATEGGFARDSEVGGDGTCGDLSATTACGSRRSRRVGCARPHSVALVVGPDPDVVPEVVPDLVPDLVDVGVVRDDRRGQTFAPQYDDYAPNGDANGTPCPPVCQVASAEVSIS